MAAEHTDAVGVERELRQLARSTLTPQTDLSAVVLQRIETEPAPRKRGTTALAADRAGAWLRARWRAVTWVVIGALVALGAATPVGATVARWFNFGGVDVVQGPPPPASQSTASTAQSTPSTSLPGAPAGASSSPAPPTGSPGPVGPSSGSVSGTGTGSGAVDLEKAADRLGFTPLVPTGLPAPDTVSIDAEDRVLTMTWAATGLRLDQFLGAPSPVFVKKMYQDIVFVSVGQDQGLWFDGPHELVYLDPDGTERRDSTRVAGRTLLWIHGPITLRLEGAGSLDRALEIAGTVR